MMKQGPVILILMTSTGWGGLELNALKLLLELKDLGYTLKVVAKGGSRFAKACEEEGIVPLLIHKTKKYFDFGNARRIAGYIEEQGVSHVVIHYRPDLDLIAWTKRKCVHPPKVIHHQQMQIGIPKKGILQRMRYKAVDVWMAPLNWLRDEVLEKTVVPKERIQIVPLGVRTEQFVSAKYDRKTARNLLNIETEAPLIGVIGRIDEKKGQLFLVQALKRIREQGHLVELLIVGEPTINDPKGKEYHTRLVNYIQEHQLQAVVHFSGFTTDVMRFYNAIDTFVMSSEGETYGMVTVEAMAAGLPVIGTNSGGTPELLGQGSRGALYTYNDIDSFVQAYDQLNKRLQSGDLNLEAIRQEVIAGYDISRELEGMIAAFNAN